MSKSVKSLINQRNISFNKGDITRSKELQKQVKRELKLAKVTYKNKVQTLLTSGSSRPAWEDVKSIMGMQSTKNPISLAGMSNSQLAGGLNIFYNCFNTDDFRSELSVFRDAPLDTSVVTNSDTVCKLFKGVKERKSPGPDNIGGQTA